MNCPLFLFIEELYFEQEVSGGCSLSSPINLCTGFIHSHFPAAFAEHGGKYGCG
jgi:hypothetical protein